MQSPSTGIYSAGTDTTAHDNLNPYYVAAIPGSHTAPALQQGKLPLG